VKNTILREHTLIIVKMYNMYEKKNLPVKYARETQQYYMLQNVAYITRELYYTSFKMA